MEWHEETAYEKILSYWRLIRMSKERLKEIEERVLVDRVYYKHLDGTKGHWGKVYTLSEEDYNYLKEQAERVQELEKELEEWQNEALRWIKLFEESQERLSKVEYVEELEKELNEWQNEAIRLFKLFEEYQELNKRYREALEHIERIQSVDVAQQIARQALEDE